MNTRNFLFGAGLIFLAGCGNSTGTNTSSDSSGMNTDTSKMRSDTVSAMKDTASSSMISDADKKFVETAANAGMMEISLGKTAEQNASSKEVKDFGAMMVADHTKAGDDLKKIADSKHMMLPAALGKDDQAMVDKLAMKKGTAFDKDYTDMMVKGHTKVLDAFQTEIKTGSDADIKGFANTYVSTISGHLEAAKKCQSSVKK